MELIKDFLRWFWSSPLTLGTVLGVPLVALTFAGLFNLYRRT